MLYPVIYQPTVELDTLSLAQVKVEATELDTVHLRVG
jgi:hypothetical protein